MKILAHRGYWKEPEEKNTLSALTAALEKGWGIETDIRDCNGEIVIAHDMADDTALKLSHLLDVYVLLPVRPLLALNVKSDGLYAKLEEMFALYGITTDEYFLFDMSVPELYAYINRGYRVFTRSSEFETQPALETESHGYWLDQFTNNGHITATLDNLLTKRKPMCIVSPELHKRPHLPLWEFLTTKNNQNLYLCTDKPDEAEVYFQ